MQIKFKTLSVIMAALALTACGGGDSNVATTAATTNITVSPSLGKFSDGALVTIKKPDGTVLGSASIAGGLGQAIVAIQAGYTGPILIEVTGGDTVSYYDEGQKASKPFKTTDKLRALAPKVQATVGVTPATNAAVVELETTKGGLTTAAAADIELSNNKIQVALGITDVLQVPTLVDINTANTLVLGNAGDKYALVLAALAKQAVLGGAKTALDVANDLANDLSDGVIDGKKGNVAMASTVYAPATFDKDMATNKYSAAQELADASTTSTIKNDASVLGSIRTDVTTVTTATVATLTDLQKAKNFFAELRTSLNVFGNAGKTGFIDTQATTAGNDLNATIGLDSNKLGDRLSTLGLTADMYTNAKNYTSTNTLGLTVSTTTITDPATGVSGNPLVSESGQLMSAVSGWGNYAFCWADSADPATVKSASCLHFGSNSADFLDSILKGVLITVKPSATVTGQYDYTAARYNWSFTPGMYMQQASLVGAPIRAKNALLSTRSTQGAQGVANYTGLEGAGTYSRTMAGSQVTQVAIKGTMPSSSSVCVATTSTSLLNNSKNCLTSQIQIPATGVETIDISGVRTALTAANNFRYTVTGSVRATNAIDTTKLASLSLDAGSYFDEDRTNSATTGSQIKAANLIGTVQTALNKFTGTITLANYKNDINQRNWAPTMMTFDGSVSDLSTGGAGQYLTGKFDMSNTNYASFNADPWAMFYQPTTGAALFLNDTITFTGTVQAPNRPLMTVTLSKTITGPNREGVFSGSFKYDNINITASGSDSGSGLGQGFGKTTLTNQDGITIAIPAFLGYQTTVDDWLVTKAGKILATVVNNSTVKYSDQSTQALN